MITETETEMLFDYEVSFFGDDSKVVFTVTETRDDVPDYEVVEKAEKALCEIWGVERVPQAYYVTEIEIYGWGL